MNRFKFLFCLSLMSMGMVALAGEGEETKVTGEIVDLSCYVAHGASGEKHRKCAQGCINKGLPMGILTAEGDVYLLMEDHDKADAYATAKGHAADKVEITGVMFEKGGMKGLQVHGCTKI